ncbi:MAG TPA: S9 family peptidase [Dongiaceae bacterium]|nr:S9 family peptidase [Dongiaceae bacterium]
MNYDYQIGGVVFSLNGPDTKAGAFRCHLSGSPMSGPPQKAVPTKAATSGGGGEGAGVEGRGMAVGSASGARAEAPLAVREPVEHVIHGDRRVDHYAWMREKGDPRVREYLEAENAYADELLRPTEGLQVKLYQEMLERIQQTDLSVPYLLRGYEYYTRTEEGKQYPIYCRRRATWLDISPEDRRKQLREFDEEKDRVPPAAEEVLLDLNELAVGHTYMGLGIFDVSDDNRYLAYATDTTGYRQYTLEVKELKAGASGEWGVASEQAQEPGSLNEPGAPGEIRNAKFEIRKEESQRRDAEGAESARREDGLLPFRAERVTSVAWSKDGSALFYVTEDAVTKRSNQLWRHEFSRQSTVDSGQQPQDPGSQHEPGAPGTWHDQSERGSPQQTLKVNQWPFVPVETRHPGSPDEVEGKGKSVREDPPFAKGAKDGAPSGSETQGDELIYEEKDERFRIDVERSRSGAYLFLVCNSHTTSEVQYLRADTPRGTFQLVTPRQDDHEYYLDHHPGGAEAPGGGVFFIRTNSGGRTYRLMTAPAEDPVRSRWREVIPNRPKVMLAGLETFRTHLVLTEREDGLPYLRIVDLTRNAASALEGSQRIEFAEPAYNAMLGTNPEFDTGHVRFQYESMVTPRSVYDYNITTGERNLKKQQPVLGGFDSAVYVSERLHANAPDGTHVPISVVRRKDTVRDGNAPLLLYGYGSYGLSMPVTFSSNRLSLLDRGFVYAIAHVRGGGELGKPWHDAGRMHRKMATFTDFIACAEYLIAKRYTTKERLVIEGGSAGGLLMGAVTNMRPDLFRVVVSHVPFVDVLNTMLDPSLPLTVGEYEEWGNPQVEKDYFYMKMYCPYTNVERKAYPRMLVKTAWNDSQVMYWEAAKYVAKLRTMKTDENVLLLKTNMGAGHGGASGRYDFLREIALDYAFVLREVGIESERV